MKEWTPSEIGKLRKALRLTRKEFGAMLGDLTVSTIFRWERGLRKPSKTARLLLSRVAEELRKGVRKRG